MKKFTFLLLYSLLILSCEKSPLVPNDPNPNDPNDTYNLEGTGKIKMKYIYSSSTDSDPYAVNSYTYDDNWNLTKILIADLPMPLFASYTYQYSDLGLLINMKYNAIEGANYPDQTEDDFTLIREYKYSYRGNNKIELEYRKNVLSDSIVYTYENNLLVSEFQYDLVGDLSYNRKYEYNSDDKLIKETYSPENTYIISSYEDTRIVRETEFDQNGSIMMDNTYSYSKADGNVIVEKHNKNFLSEKTTYKDGNIIEYVKYHPTFSGEWYCHKYIYY